MADQRPSTPYPVFRQRKVPPQSEKEDDISRYCREMLQKSMLTGVPQIVSAPTTRSKVFKTFVFLGSVTGFLYQTSAFLVMYFSYPTLVDVQVTTPPFVDVPSITICNSNGLRRKEYCRLKPENCKPLTNTKKFCEHYPEACDADTITGGIMYPMYEFLADEITATQKEINDAGHPSYPLIRECKFEVVNVTFEICKNETFQSFIFQDLDGRMKKCYILNARWSKASLNLPTVPTRAVLRLTIDLEPEEYFRFDREVTGQIAIHSPWNILNPFSEGMPIHPGKTYIIHLKEDIKNLLPRPYQTNCTDYIENWQIRGMNGPLSKEMCIEECILNQTMDHCKCVLTSNLYPHNFKFCGERFDKNYSRSVREATDFCTNQVNFTHCFVKCSPACHSRHFDFTVQEKKMEEVVLGPGDSSPKSLNWNRTAILLLLFKRTQVNTYRYRAKYESIEFFSFLGGFVGIWLGVSLIALLDFLESLATFCVFLIDRLKSSNKISEIRSAIGSRIRSDSTFSTDSIPWAKNHLRVGPARQMPHTP